MQTRIQRWGNSLGLRIPKAFAEEAGVDDGSPVDISFRGGKIIVRPTRRRRLRLDDLLREVRPDNMHDPADSGAPRGKETW